MHSAIQKWPDQLAKSEAAGKYKTIRKSGLPLQESMDIMKNASEKFSVARGKAGESVSTK
jgi:hypothetical protein